MFRAQKLKVSVKTQNNANIQKLNPELKLANYGHQDLQAKGYAIVREEDVKNVQKLSALVWWNKKKVQKPTQGIACVADKTKPRYSLAFKFVCNAGYPRDGGLSVSNPTRTLDTLSG